MKYVSFLEACRKLAGVKHGKDLNKSEFAKLCGVVPRYYANVESDNPKAEMPGRPLLEKAAVQAGFEFENCINIPVEIPVTTAEQDAINEFRAAIGDWRKDHALMAAWLLRDLPRPPRPTREKRGGRARNKK